MQLGGPDDHDPTADDLDDDLAALGLVLDVGPADAAGDDGRTFYLWPEHEPVVRLWLDVQTQWRVGFNGPTGLDYQGVEALMRLRGIKRGQAGELFSGLQIMELAALREFADQRRQRGK